ncbi:hypothetical protein UlMin_032617 [Ulmus minor]
MEVVTGVVSSVVAKILEYPVRHIGRHLGYLIYYQTNKKSLIDRVLELGNKISSVQRSAVEAGRNGEQLEECVTGWIKKAEEKFQEAKAAIEDRGHENAKCSCNGSFPNLVSRYKLSKKAKILAEKIVIDLREVDDFRKFSYRPHIQPSFKNKDFEAFVSRTKTLEEIMEALRDPNLTMIGVYGMGGVGKTTLVNEVARQAKEEQCFSDVVMVTVSQKVDLKSIQNRIAEWLGLTLDGEDMSRRAIRLRDRLTQEKKILIILDDIWREVDLLEVGINFEAGDQKGCKILLVSRDRDVLCSLMDVTKIIEVKVLSDREAEGLFNKFVGDKADNSDFKELANQVVGECGCLPIAIVTIARSLKNKDILFWKDFLYRLKSSRGMEGKVYTSIKMSYDVLQSEEEKKLLLLCSLHGEDANVYVNDLMFYGIGWDLFEGVHTMEEARCRAHSLVEKLKDHCLLLDGDDEDTVKMHDVIRDVMISIANEDEHMHCLTKVADLEDGDFRESKAIMLVGPDFDNQLLPSLVCPKLQLLLARGSIPDDFFKEAQELKALSFDCKPLQSLPQSFCTLRHLRALRLRLGNNEDLTLIGELTNLIALDLSESTFSQLPEHIGKLTRLRSLNLSGCHRLRVIQPNVISSLVRLEELYMDGVYINWEVEGRVGEGRNASLVEFKNLRNLTALHLNVRDADVLPKDMFSANLQRFRIMIGSILIDTEYFTGSRLLFLNLRESSQLYQCGIQKLMKNSEVLWLEEFHGVDNTIFELEINSFPQLRELYISSCRNLKNIFTVALAGRLAQLERLEIRRCPIMEEVVFTNERGEGRLEKILFPKLKYLELEDLPNLKRFCTGDCIECPSLLKLEIENCGVPRNFISSNEEEVEGPFFNEKVSFPILENLRLKRMNLKILWADQLSITSFGMPNLKRLYVSDCDSLSHLFSLDVARSLLQLEELQLRDCKDTEEELVTKEPIEEETPIKIFPKLKNLELYNLQNIRRFCAGCCIEFPSLTNMMINGRNAAMITDSCNGASGELMGFEARQPFFNGKVAFPKLEELDVSGLDSVNSLFSFAVAKSLVTLRKLEVSRCSLMEQIVQVNEQGEEGRLDKISFPKLERIHFECLSNLKRFYEKSEELMGSEATQPLFNGTVAFPKLEELKVRDLDSVNSLFSFAVAKSLVTLKTLGVWSCNLMEEIVQANEQGKEGRLDKISFPKLESVNFYGLSNLKRFYGGACIEFPSLLKLEMTANKETEEKMDIVVAEQHLVFNEVLGPNLEKLATTWSELIKQMCTCQSSRAPPFCNLKDAQLKCFRNEPIGFSLKCIQRYQNLESLSLGGFFVDSTHHHQQLMVSSEEHERPLKHLKKLSLCRLFMLTHLYEDSEDSENSSLESLKFLRIQECSRLKSPLLSSMTSFQNLMALVVSECSAMINLLASSTAKTLVHLRLMSITECKQMTEIITDEIVDDEIVFGKLEILELIDLPGLRSFHSAGNSVMRFPNLEMLVVSQCPEMRRFSFGTIDAPKLDSISKIEKNKYRWVWLDAESEFDDEMLSCLPEPQQKLWEGDINKTLEKLWEEDDYSLVM